MSQPPSQANKLKEKEDKEAKKKARLEKKAEDDAAAAANAYWKKDISEFAQKGDIRWKTLSHNGVVFPPPYVPHGIPIYYGTQLFHMNPEEEELATMFAEMRDTDYYQKPRFRNNFFTEWRKVLDKRGSHPIEKLELCDFTAIYENYRKEVDKRKSRSPEEKKKKKEEEKALDAKYKYCLWDGRKEKIANYIVEKPGLFRGRGDHPKTGMLKARVYPEQVIINIGEGEEVPPPPPGHQWKEIIHDHRVTWLASWKDSVNDNVKYMMLAASSAVKGESDILKFEKARALEKHVADVRASYHRDFHSKDIGVQQRAVATYFIDKLALRAGNSKDDQKEADTVGCCSLRRCNITPLPNNMLYFNFKGKDSIDYINTVEVDPVVHALISKWHKMLANHQPYFGDNEPDDVNEHLKSFMPGLTAKVFRTYNASRCLQNEFDTNPCSMTASEPEKVEYFNAANTKVALLCNHQRSVPKSFGTTKMKMNAKLDELREHVARLTKCIEIEAAEGQAAAIRYFYAEEDRVQQEWLDKYGTEEQKQAYRDQRQTREDDTKKRTSKSSSSKTPNPNPKPRASGTKKGAAAADEDSEDEHLMNVLNKPRKQRKAAQPADNASSDDELLVSALKSKGIPAGKKGSASSKKAPAAAASTSSSSSSEDEQEKPKKRGGKTAKQAESEDEDKPKPKKGRGKPTVESDNDSDEDEKKANTPKAGKKAAAKKAPSPKASPKKAAKKASPAKQPSPKKASPAKKASPKKGKPSPKKASPKASPKKASPKHSPKKAAPKAVQQAKKKR